MKNYFLLFLALLMGQCLLAQDQLAFDDFNANRITWQKLGGGGVMTISENPSDAAGSVAHLDKSVRYAPSGISLTDDYMVECLVMPTVSNGGGVSFRGTNVNNTAGIEFGNVDGTGNAEAHIWRRVDNVSGYLYDKDGVQLKSIPLPFSVKSDSWYRQVAIVRGGIAMCYVGEENTPDDSLTFIATVDLSGYDDVLLTGLPGIFTYGAKPIYVDNFEVTSLVNATEEMSLPTYQENSDLMDATRFQIHTLLEIANVGALRIERIGIKDNTGVSPQYGEDMWFSLPQYMARMGVDAYCRHFRTAGEAAIWPSNHGAHHAINDDYGTPDMAQMFIDDSHDLGIGVVAYYRHEADVESYNMGIDAPNPTSDYIAYDRNGVEQESTRGIYISLVSPYADDLIERCEELAEKGVTSFYFDERHVHENGDFSQWSQTKFNEWGGSGNLTDASDADIRAHRFAIMEDFFPRLQDSIRTKNPYATALVSSTSLQMKTLCHYDHVKTEPNLFTAVVANGFYSLSDGMSVVRDATEGRAPHVWLATTNYYDLSTEQMARFLAYGAIYNRHGSLTEFANPDSLNPLWQEQADLAYKVNPYLAGTKPYNHVLVVADEDIQHGDHAGYNQGVSDAFINAFYTVKDHGVPAGTILPHQIASHGIPAHVSYVVFPDNDTVPADLSTAISTFIEAGGEVIYSGAISGDKETTATNTWFDGKSLPIYTTGGLAINDFGIGANQEIDDFMDVVSFKKEGTNRRVINFSNGPQSGVKLYIADSMMHDEVVVYEPISNTVITPVHSNGYYEIAVPDFSTLATIIIEDEEVETSTSLVYVNNDDAGIAYEGTWTDEAPIVGQSPLSASVKSASNTTGTASASYTFEGTEVQVAVQKRLDGASVDIYLDDVLVKGYYSTAVNSSDYYNDSIYSQYIVYRNPNLEAGEHTIKIVSSSEWHPFSAPKNTYFDYFAYRPLGTLLEAGDDPASLMSSTVPNENLDIQAYPKPTDDVLYIQAQHDFTSLSYEIISASGQVMKQGSTADLLENEVLTISLSDLSSGIYFLRYKGTNREGKLLSKSLRVIKTE